MNPVVQITRSQGKPSVKVGEKVGFIVHIYLKAIKWQIADKAVKNYQHYVTFDQTIQKFTGQKIQVEYLSPIDFESNQIEFSWITPGKKWIEVIGKKNGELVKGTISTQVIPETQTASQIAYEVLVNGYSLDPKGNKIMDPNTQKVLDPILVQKIYAAEKKRLSWYEKWGIDGHTVGRGQVSQITYQDVMTYFLPELNQFLTKRQGARLQRCY